MDSKLLTKAILVVTLFVGSVFVLMLGVNGYLTPKQPAQEVVMVEETIDYLEEDGMVKDANLSAWMMDETFFDQKKSATLEKIEQNAKTLQILATSIEKDLRVHILDGSGKQVDGYPFHVKVGDLGIYKDADKDGVVYIGDVKPGQYLVSIEAIDDFNLPEEPVLVDVKAKIEYKAIDDISYLIKTEEEIDAKAEDTAVNDAALDAVGSTGIMKKEGATFGIDVSKWNKEIDWAQVKKEGVDYAMIRAGYRGSVSGSLVEDPYFRKNIEGALKNDIEVGVYFFTQAINEVEAVEEASIVLSLIEGYDITYPVIIDSEGAGGNGRADKLDVPTRSRICEAFCETIRSAGYVSGIYASKNWLNNNLDITKFSADNVIWLAEYKDAPTYGGKYSMWQYTSSGRLNGIEGRVDFNQCYTTFSNKVKDTEQGADGLNGTEKVQEPKPDKGTQKVTGNDEDPER